LKLSQFFLKIRSFLLGNNCRFGNLNFQQQNFNTQSTNDVVKISGTLTEGGTLNVINIGAAAFTNGDSFKLFQSGSCSGAFAAYILPLLGPNLEWRTTTLNGSGVIIVGPLISPTIRPGRS